jgi:hypothetical protein
MPADSHWNRKSVTADPKTWARLKIVLIAARS